MQGHTNDPAPEHHDCEENGLYMRFVSYEHTGRIFVIISFFYYLVTNG